MPFDRTHTEDLLAFLSASPSPYHAVEEVRTRLDAAGFRQLPERAAWAASPGGRYIVRGGAVIAWMMPEKAPPYTSFRIVAAHTDSPSLRLKPRPDLGRAGPPWATGPSTGYAPGRPCSGCCWSPPSTACRRRS
ncbi:hypothetical protein EJK15_53960 [Nonomuraea basaltis]|nr:hypothetical protein EJK15_53960 [Nonomuraea basaltis]